MLPDDPKSDARRKTGGRLSVLSIWTAWPSALCSVACCGVARMPPTTTASAETELRAARQVSAGFWQTCAVLQSGEVACWGRQSVLGELDDVIRPGRTPGRGFALVSGLRDAVEVSVVEGDSAGSCARRRDGSFRCWGSEFGFRATVPGPFISIAYGCGLVSDGSVACIGARGTRECLGNNNERVTDPNCVTTDYRGSEGGYYRQLAVGVRGFYAVTRTGQVVTWSRGVAGRSWTVPGVHDAVKVAVGWRHYCALLRQGTIVCWGQNFLGELGVGTVTDPKMRGEYLAEAGSSTPVRTVPNGENEYFGHGEHPPGSPVRGIGRATDLTLGPCHGCALIEDGSLWCWGSNGGPCPDTTSPYCRDGRCPDNYPVCPESCGQLGNGSTGHSPVPVRVPFDEPIVNADAGYYHTCAVGQSGRVYCWGCNGAGQVTPERDALATSCLSGCFSQTL